jgi:hypothetical protein
MAARSTQIRRAPVSKQLNKYRPERQSILGQQNRYFTFCEKEVQGFRKKEVTLPTLKFLDKPEEEIL